MLQHTPTRTRARACTQRTRAVERESCMKINAHTHACSSGSEFFFSLLLFLLFISSDLFRVLTQETTRCKGVGASQKAPRSASVVAVTSDVVLSVRGT